jgi:hypothetical protein
MKKLVGVLLTVAVVLGLSLAMSVPVAAEDPIDPPNTVASSTMIFQGTLTYEGNGVYTGTIAMVNESATGLGDSIAGFDIYAKWGGCAYVLNYYGTGNWNCDGVDTAIIGSNHDAYSSGGPWGPWYDPDCADWDCYSLELTADHWYLRYTATGESSMSGEMDWNAMYAAETDKGTWDPEDDGVGPYEVYADGGPQMWDWNAGAQVERIPLQFPGFDVSVAGPVDGGVYRVTLTPAKADSTVLTANVPDITAISVIPTSIDFGDLLPGQTSDVKQVTVKNVGTRAVNVDASLDASSDTLFDNLVMRFDSSGSFGTGPWDDIITSLAMDGSKYVQTRLPVPSDYTPSGTETGLLIFEAEAV